MENLQRKGRKSNKDQESHKNIYSTQDNKNVPIINDENNIIVKLSINKESLSNDNTMTPQYVSDNAKQPFAYNEDWREYESVKEEQIYESELDVFPIDYQDDKRVDNCKVVNLLQDFEEKNKVNEWPMNTSISCYWCCHKFNTSPFGIPISYDNSTNKFSVFGCFCSLECASAYNFKINNNIDEMWERYNLMNTMSRILNIGRVVKPAPDRLALKMFGGYMTINEFRKNHESSKVVNLNFPPMTSLTQQIEEVNDYEIFNDFKFIPIDNDRIDKYKERVFKRNKPVINSKNTIESSMKLKYESSSGNNHF